MIYCKSALRFCAYAGIGFLAVLLSACSRSNETTSAAPAILRLQTDWYPQAEHGGFYQALAKGYYTDEGLEVDILPGGLNFMGALKVTEGQAHFAMHKADAILRHQAQGMPLKIVMATLQHDPQGILLHASNPISNLMEIDGQPLIAMPGAAWLEYLRLKFNVEPVLIPHDKGMERFLSDPRYLQQCMVTSEPYFASLQGVETKVLLLRNSGFDPYHVVYTHTDLAEQHPEIVDAFVRASIRGWVDFLTSDPTPAFEIIKERNPRQTDELLNFSRHALIDGGFAFDNADPASFGQIDPGRMRQMENQMREIGLLE